MSTNLNVIALISGGKDSVYSIYHCLAQGHKIVALANLYPSNNGQDGEDIDSFMYQTVGHTVIPHYEDIFQIPLFRTKITGTAVNTDKYYHTSAQIPKKNEDRPQDEIESLYVLLQRIKNAHPEVNAVSTGAILSDYQRSRVESIVRRLDMQSLAYLWQYPYLPPHMPASLLEDMEAIGHRALIIKVASGGLNESFLGQNVADSRIIAKLRRGLERFGTLQGGSILGEGGEYETLSIDGPGILWKESVEIDPQETKIITGEAGTAVLNIPSLRLVAKNNDSSAELDSLRIPGGLDAEFERLKQNLATKDTYDEAYGKNEDSASVEIGACKEFSISQTKDTVYINNLSISTNNWSANGEMNFINDQISCLLREYGLSSSDVTSTTLILRSMSDFKAINAFYDRFFSHPQPPSRVTVACGSSLPAGVHAVLSLVASGLGPSYRRALHVQSISYWAPANIGPYSQAVGIASPFSALAADGKRAEVVHMAGQIPLVPATMELVNLSRNSAEFREQTVLALQHLWRVGRAMSVENWLVGLAFVAAPSLGHDRKRRPLKGLVDVATDAWTALYDDARRLDGQQEESGEDETDVWDRKYGLNREGNQSSSEMMDTRHRLPNLARVKLRSWMYQDINIQSGPGTTPPCFVIEVDELPRGAQVEWTSLGLVNGDLEIGVQSESQNALGTLNASESGPLKESKAVEYHSCRIKQTEDSFVWVGIDDIHERNLEAICREILRNGKTPPACTVYAAQDLPDSFAGGSAMQVIPCRSVWECGDRRLAALLFFKIEGEKEAVVES